MGRRLLLGLVVVLILAGGGVTAYQRVAASRVKSGFEAWADTARADGWQVSWGAPTISGWPLAAVVNLPDFRFSGATPGGPAWESQQLRLRLDLFHPDHLTVVADGNQRAGIASQQLHPFSAHLLRLDVPFSPSPGGPLAGLTTEALHAPDPGVDIGSAGISIMEARPDLKVRIGATSIALPAGDPWPLGSHVAEIQADAVLSATPGKPAPLAVLARQWRADGGQLRVTQGVVRWGPLDADIEAVAGLDPSLQPVVSGRAFLTGYAQALDLMAARHFMSNDAALAAKAVLSLVAQGTPGAGPRVEAPFTVRDQLFSVGPIPLLRLRPIAWDGS